MQAHLITGRERIEAREVPEPEARAGAAVVAIERCGICGTDVAAWRSGNPYPPFLCGHEWVGRVAAAGSGVTRVREGDRVVLGVPVACGDCAECRAGHAHRCAAIMALAYGIHPLTPPHGGYAPRIAVPADHLVFVPEDLPVDAAAQVEPATVALHGVRRRPPRLGDRVLVLGAGPIGLYAAQLARIAGAGEVYVLEPRPERCALASTLGATLALAPEPAGLEAIRARTGGLGVDLVYECSGSQAAMDAGFDLVRPGGAFMLIGVASAGIRLDPLACITKEILLDNATAHHHHEFRITIDLMRDGRLHTDAIHSRTVAPAALAEAFASLAAGRDAKILVSPGD